MLNLRGDIIPGHSAAGFSLGQPIDDVVGHLPDLQTWRPGDGNLATAIRSTESLLTGGTGLGSQAEDGKVLYLKRGTVVLHFNAAGRLYQIEIFSGYLGQVFSAIGVGDNLSKFQPFTEMSYDDGDEMYYPVNDDINGLGIYAAPDGSDVASQKIFGMSIHNWTDS